MLRFYYLCWAQIYSRVTILLSISSLTSYLGTPVYRSETLVESRHPLRKGINRYQLLFKHVEDEEEEAGSVPCARRYSDGFILFISGRIPHISSSLSSSAIGRIGSAFQR